MRAVIFGTLLLAACGGNAAREELPSPQLPQRAGVDPLVAARAEGVEFRAVGDGFVLDIFADRIRLTMTADGSVLSFAKPAPQYPRWNGSIYTTSDEQHRMRVEIRDYRPCETGDRATYPTSVSVTLDGREMEGCGREF